MTTINPQPFTMTVGEIRQLGDRLFGRGVSHFSLDEMNMKGDMLLASAVIFALIRGRELEETITVRIGVP